jgi:hypothetical protein
LEGLIPALAKAVAYARVFGKSSRIHPFDKQSFYYNLFTIKGTIKLSSIGLPSYLNYFINFSTKRQSLETYIFDFVST